MSVELKFIGNFKKFNFFKKLIIFGIFQKNLISYKFRRHENLIAIIKKMSTKRTHDDSAPDQRKRTQPLPSALTGVTSDLGYIVSDPFKKRMHPLLATAYTDRWSWFSLLPECVLAAVISYYLTVDRRAECYPGVLDIGDQYGDFNVTIVSIGNSEGLRIRELQIAPCGDVRIFNDVSDDPTKRNRPLLASYRRAAKNAAGLKKYQCKHYDPASQRTIFVDLKKRHVYDMADPETHHTLDLGDARELEVQAVCMDARGRIVIAHEFTDENWERVMRIIIFDTDRHIQYIAEWIGALNHADVTIHSMRVRYDGAVLMAATVNEEQAVLGMQFQPRLPLMRLVRMTN